MNLQLNLLLGSLAISVWKIENATLVDPSREAPCVGDLWISEGKIIQSPATTTRCKVFDATGMIVMPGAIDMHSHFVGPKVNAARILNARTQFFAGDVAPTSPYVPHLQETGWRYAGLGYTTAFDAAVPPAYAREVLGELQALPCVDAGFFALTGNHQYLLQAVQDNDQDRVTQFLQSIIRDTGAWAAKIVNPGGVEDWKSGYREGVGSIDQTLHRFQTTPRHILRAMAQANDQLGLPHAIHVHCNRLGLPGNWQTTLDTMKSVGDARCHLAHIQFHSYRGADDEAAFGSAVDPLVDYLNAHPNLSVDVGQVMFGETMSMTADSALGYYLQKVTGRPWISHDTELECGCGISPIKYRRKDRIHGLQWAIGLEWMLKIQNPWQLALSTDHPNGASFLTYPQIIALLMDRDYRRQQIEQLHDGVREHSDLYEIDREYSIQEVAVITRGAPARLLGLAQKGHLQIGGDADLVIYAPGDDKRRMFEFPRMVIKRGQILLDDGEPRELQSNHRFSAAVSGEEITDFDVWMKRHSTA